jgi:hypothetical protein
MFGRKPSAPIVSPATRATMPLLVAFSRHENTSVNMARAAMRSVSMSKVSLPSPSNSTAACFARRLWP